MNSMIDWNGKLEAVDGGGKVWPLEISEDVAGGVVIHLPDGFAAVQDGASVAGDRWWWSKDENGKANSWLPTIRNTKPEQAKDNSVSPADDIAARMEALVREMASQSGPEPRFIERARAIVAELPEVVDPVEAIVDELLGWDQTTRVIVKEALRRGRALERGE
jgi:hypothetical protein